MGREQGKRKVRGNFDTQLNDFEEREARHDSSGQVRRYLELANQAQEEERDLEDYEKTA